LVVPESGSYAFHFQANGAFSDVKVAGRTLYRAGGSPVAEPASPLVARVDLQAGTRVPIEVRFSTQGQSWVSLHWTRPNGRTELIPPSVLEPTP
jgi:hypothetical protein